MVLSRAWTALIWLALSNFAFADQPELQGHTGDWCVVLKSSQACLPSPVTIMKVGPSYVEFDSPDPDDLSVKLYITLHFLDGESNQYLDGFDSQDSPFTRVEEWEIGELSARKYKVKPSLESVPRMTLYVVEKTDSFALQVSCMTDALARNIVQDLAGQWNAKDRNPRPWSDDSE